MNSSLRTGSDRSVDVAAVALRATLGPMLISHGWNKIAGPGGIEGTTRWFDSLGLRPAAAHARLAAVGEIMAGAGLVLGLANPLPAAATVGLMSVAAATDHRGKGFFVFKGGWEYVGVVAGTAVALAGLGHGRFSIDGARGGGRTGLRPAATAATLGVTAAGVLLKLCYRPAPTEAGTADA
ncbi:DoxX family protein [Nocardia jiangxiensis]|uniref:DoxX family protein n=1 Tax=Nocardia jiangxiensis TaxID=282685 RepID=A0ABW6S3V1_9NOCA|nr:DoxX family protein [Nocardia jiangxiensis]